jgi:hypothetical protein
MGGYGSSRPSNQLQQRSGSRGSHEHLQQKLRTKGDPTKRVENQKRGKSAQATRTQWRGATLITPGKKGPDRAKMAGENPLQAARTRRSTSAAWRSTRPREPTAKDALLSRVGRPAGLKWKLHTLVGQAHHAQRRTRRGYGLGKARRRRESPGSVRTAVAQPYRLNANDGRLPPQATG